MIYDEQRHHTEYRMLAKRDRALMGADMKVYRQAEWTGKKWKLGLRVSAQAW